MVARHYSLIPPRITESEFFRCCFEAVLENSFLDLDFRIFERLRMSVGVLYEPFWVF